MKEYRDSLDPDGNVLSVSVATPTYVAYFCLDGGELLEAEADPATGMVDWNSAGVCDTARGSNPRLQLALREALNALTAEAHGEHSDPSL